MGIAFRITFQIIRLDRTGFVKHGFVKGGFVKHGFVKGGFVKHIRQ